MENKTRTPLIQCIPEKLHPLRTLLMHTQISLELGLSHEVVEPSIELFLLLDPPLACFAPRADHAPNAFWLGNEAGKESVVKGLSDEGAFEDGAGACGRFFFLLYMS